MLPCAKFYSLTFLLLFAIGLLAQSDPNEQRLEQQKIKLLDEIEYANKILDETRATRKISLSNVQTVEQKLRLRKNLIATLDKETELLEIKMQELQIEADTLKEQVDRLKLEYAEMIRKARQSSNSTSRLMFILSSQSFNQALRRMEYLKQYSEFRRKQVEEIQQKEKELQEKLASLNVQKVKKEAIKGQMQLEQKKLVREKNEQELALKSLQSKESEIAKNLKKKEKEAKKLEGAIQKIIAAQIELARSKAIRGKLEEEAAKLHLRDGTDFTTKTTNTQLQKIIAAKRAKSNAPAKATTPAPKTTTYALTPEASKLAANFAANKGRLPWPVERGLTVRGYGPQRHPEAPGVTVDYKGIDIATTKGSKARASFGGEVANILVIPSVGYAVILMHGNYFSIYQNLETISVKKGQKVSNNQEIGLIRTDPSDGKTVLHFQIWQETKTMDPQPWLIRK